MPENSKHGKGFEIKGKNSMFKDMLKVSSLSETYGELVIEIYNEKYLMIKVKDGGEKTTVMSRGIYTGFEKTTCDGEKTSFGVNVSNVLGYLKDLFTDDEVITFVQDGSDLLIIGAKDTIRTSLLEPRMVKTYTENLDFIIDETKKVALYKKGTVVPTTIATLDSQILRDIAVRAGKVKQEYYPINIEPKNKISCEVGSRKKDKTKDTIAYTTDQALVDGEPCVTTLGNGFKEVVSVLKGSCQISGVNPDKIGGKQAPLWIYQATENYEVGFFIAPRTPEQ